MVSSPSLRNSKNVQSCTTFPLKVSTTLCFSFIHRIEIHAKALCRGRYGFIIPDGNIQ